MAKNKGSSHPKSGKVLHTLVAFCTKCSEEREIQRVVIVSRKTVQKWMCKTCGEYYDNSLQRRVI